MSTLFIVTPTDVFGLIFLAVVVVVAIGAGIVDKVRGARAKRRPRR